jgi:flavodoxin
MSTNFTPKIIWEKWSDPFGDDIVENSWHNYDNENSPEIDDQIDIIDQIKKPVKVISSPMGLIPYNEYTASSKIFNFWVGHCNFNLSKKIVESIEKVEGVELLDIFTRYRFRIAVGKSFTDSQVMNEIKLTIHQIFNCPIYYDN